MDYFDQLIRSWRETAADPSTADIDELNLRRHIAEHEDKCGKCKSGLETVALEAGFVSGMSEKLAQRRLIKEVGPLHERIEQLEAQLTELRKHLWPAGGGIEKFNP
jgi:hypothetical protein